MLMLNSTAMTILVSAMQELGSITAATVTSNSTSVFSGILGAIIFKEHIKSTWIAGVVLIITGVAILNRAAYKHTHKTKIN
jgi:drug/metabolite transporter (DMT)-like permease